MTDFKIGDRVRVKIDSKSWQNCRVIGESFGLVSVRDLDADMRGSFFKAAIERLADAADSKPGADGDRFQPGDVIRDENGKLWVIDESMDPYGRLVAGSPCRLEYRATPEALRLFSQPTSAMCIEQNRGFPVWLYAGPGLVMFADVDFVGECFRTRTLHPESALRWLKQKESEGQAVLHNHGNGPPLAQEDPSKRPVLEQLAKRMWCRDESAIAIGAPSVPMEPFIMKRAKPTHCARCGDPFPLDQSNESICRFRGEWYHQQCATVLAESLEEERKSKLLRVGPDPYKRVTGKDICAEVDNVRGMTMMQIEREEQRRSENAALFGRRVPERFTADSVPERKAVVHPWECDEAE